MIVALSLGIAFLGVCVAGLSLYFGRHASRRYKTENEEAALLRHDKQRQVTDVILGVPGLAPSLDVRLQRIHDRARIIDERVARVELTAHDMQKELHPNGGGSMRDDVNLVLQLSKQADSRAERVERDLAVWRGSDATARSAVRAAEEPPKV